MIGKHAIPVIAGVIMVMGASNALAQDTRVIRDRQVYRTAHMRGGGVWKDLDLNDDQKKKVEAIFDKQRRDAIKMKADLEVAGLDMRKLMRADAPDRNAINSQIDRMSNMRAQLRKAQVGAMLDVRAVLTPEQQKKMRDAHPMGPGGMGGMRRMDGEGDGEMGALEGPPPPDEADTAH